MFKKIMAALMCITMAAAFVGCGSDKDSSSKSESSATEAVTEAAETETEAGEEDSEIVIEDDIQNENIVAEAESEDEAEAANEAAEQSMDTEAVKELLLSGKWQSGYVADAQGNIMTIADYCETIGTDPSTFDLQIEFAEDGTVKLNSTADGEETGTYTVDGILITMTDDADSSQMILVYDEENDMLFIDLLGTGELLIGFTVE